MPGPLPDHHAESLSRILAAVEADARFDAILGAGSMIHGGFDEHSDLDLVLVVRDDDYAEVLESRHAIAQVLGDLLAAFTGEYVGEPRLLICLYGPPLIHVDLKFVRLADLAAMIERPRILWARTPADVAGRIDTAAVAWPNKDPQWFEDRAWVWLHYCAARLLRGELFEAIGMLGFFRENVLGPMLRQAAGEPQRGVRRIDGEAEAVALRGTHPAYDGAEIARALGRSIELYQANPPLALVRHMPETLRRMVEAE
jgi:hypothetical protein